MIQSTYKLQLFADYFQLVIMDEKSEEDFSSIWTDEAANRMLAVGDKAVCPGTLRNVDVDIEIDICSERPKINYSEWDNIAEASISIPSGTLVVMGCTDYLPEAMRIEMEPGDYQLLSLIGGIDSIRNEWEPANDLYKVILWPGSSREPQLIKSWKNRAT